MNLSKIAAVVIWYNPSPELAVNISRYVDGVGRLFVVDNSLQPNTQCVDLLSQYSNIEYLWLGDNMGIAHALNVGAQIAYEQGYEWLLTMDQDSHFYPLYIEQMFDVLSALPQADQVGILAAVPSCSASVEGAHNVNWKCVDVAFTSGNLVRIQAWNETNGWDEQMFIDSVDYDFDFKVQLAGYKIIQCNWVVFSHVLGNNVTKLKLFGREIIASTNHNYIRRYYITRNRLYLSRKYKNTFATFIKREHWFYLKEAIRILLAEPDKYRKFRSMWHGYRDYKKEVMGRYEER